MNVLLTLNSLHCGGIEKSAIALLAQLVRGGDDVTLAICDRSGEFLQFVPQGVKIIDIPYSSDIQYEIKHGKKRLLLYHILHFRLVKALKVIFFALREARLAGDHRVIATYRRYCNSIPSTGKMYDAAYCFSEFTELVYVAECVKARHKAVWLHTEQNQNFSNVREYFEFLEKMDDIYCVSDALVEATKMAIPELAARIKRYHHIVDFAAIRALGQAYVADWPVKEGALRILSVGRLARQKGFDLVMTIAKKLKDNGIKFSWMILGEGSERVALEQMRVESEVTDCVLLPGVLTNPYPYFKACDIYVQPSRYEGYCLTLAEARAFAKPIVATDFNGAREQLKNGDLGLIVNCSVKEIAGAVEKLIRDGSLRQHLHDSLEEI